MEVKTQVATKFNLTDSDVRNAIAAYITANGHPITEEDLPEHVAKDLSLTFIIESENTVDAVAKPVTKSRTKPAPKPEATLKAVEEESAVPQADVEAYRAKLAADAKAKVAADAEAMKKALEATKQVFAEAEVITQAEEAEVVKEPVVAKKTVSIFDDEPEIVATPKQEAVTAIAAHTDTLDASEAVVAKTTNSIFDTDDAPIQASSTVTKNLFA